MTVVANNISSTSGENFSTYNSHNNATSSSAKMDRRRFNSWGLLFLFSTLALTAHETDDNKADSSGANALVTAVTSITMTFSAVASVAHLGKSGFSAVVVGTVVEGLMALISLALWAGCLPIVMDPRKGLAQMYVGKQSDSVIDYQPIISNANLYFTSWGSAVCILSVFALYVRERLGGSGVGGSGGMGYTNWWYWLGLASVVVVIEGMRFKNQVCAIDGGTETATCGRNIYGLVTGIIGLILSVIISVFSTIGKDSALVTTISSFLCAILYTLCAGLLTFDKGPATYVGNQYLAAWSGFFLSFVIFGSVVKEFMHAGSSSSAPASSSNNNNDLSLEEDETEMDRI